MTDLATLDATAQADLVQRGDASPIDLVDAAIARIEALDPSVGALVDTRFERARDEARGTLPDGPFRGVPMLVKDGVQHSAGDRYQHGMRFLRDSGYRSPADTELVRLLGRSGRPVVVAVNKSDVQSHDARAAEFHRLGVEQLVPTSAAHGRGIDELLDVALAVMPVPPSDLAEDTPGTRVALMGRPNVGKSSLLNRLLGVERVLVSHEPGTTRDTIDTPVVVDGRPYVLIDTAGIRRRGRAADAVERHGAVRALGTLVRSDVVLMVLDATQGVTDQDARLIGRAVEAGRALVVVVNKWDLQPRQEQSLARWRRRTEGLHAAASGLPVIAVSARTGEGVADIFPLVRRLEASYARVIPTAALNRALREAVAAHAPPSPGGRPVRLFYATQTGTKPPHVVVFASAPSLLRAAYRRYLLNALSERFKLEGVPLRLSFRARREALNPRRRSRDSAPRARRSGRPIPRAGRPRRG
jgi:GTP-binding protein